jgi:MFS family permease
MIRKFLQNFKVNRVVGYFIFADLILFSGWGLISPIFSIFVIEKIAGSTLLHIGIGAAVYWIVKSLIQLPLGRFLDAKENEKLSLYVLLSGLLMTSFAAFAFLFMTLTWHLYLVQFIHGLGMAFYVVSWYGIFSHHLDKNKAAFEWAMNSSSLGFASGIMALVGGYVANSFGFEYIFIAAGSLSALSAVVIFLVPDLIIPNRHKPEGPMQDHTPKTINH